ncbi:MAG: translation initiation factor IF-2 [Clostridiaceae bacterium]|nr:translation initiation factor IF-2 [Clostridiaceae bacterium]
MTIRHTGVAFLNKPKIHELAKELNVTSKRLMEKLNEIKIFPKSHMTTLEDDELEKLYKHIGVVKRVKNDVDNSPSDVDSKPDLAESNTRKSAPRIIRKTEVIFHDDIPLQEPKEKKERKGFVRSSDSNDGLMAGYTRKRENAVTNVKKRTKPEREKPVEEIKPLVTADVEKISDVHQTPVDDILSIKKVVKRPKNIDNDDEKSISAKEQENMQKDVIIDETEIQSIKKIEKVTKAPVEIANKEKAENENASEDTPKAGTMDTQVIKPKQTDEEKIVSSEAEEKKVSSVQNVNAKTSDESKGAQREEKPKLQDRPRTSGNNQQREEFKPRERAPREGGYQGQRQGEFRPREGGSQGGYQGGQRQGGYQGGYQGQRQSGYQGGQGGYQGGYQGQRQGGQGGSQGGYQGQRQGEFKPREGGNQGGYQGQRQGGYQGGYQGQRQGGYQGGYQGQRQGGAPYGARPPYDKDSRSGDFRQDGNRGPAGGRNKPLAIPKAAAPSGSVEEKVFTRGERRSFQGVERQKEEKKEQKKEVSRSSAGGTNRSNDIKKKLDTVIGHKAKVTDMMSDDFVIDVFYNDRQEAINAKRAEKRIRRNKLKEKYIPPKAVLTDITVNETLTVKELAEALKKTSADVIKRLFLMGITATQNEELDYDTAAIIGDEFGIKVHKAVVVSQEDILFDDSDDDGEFLEPRAPIVVVMGHVDHGKTSLLDAIRSAKIAEQEAGGIIQTIGAYKLNLNRSDITFLDTPCHEPFTAMRARGAQVTDIAILVVAADDGVMPQTVEAINHAKAAGVSIIVAINKIDKPNANPDRVKQDLTEHGLLVEEWGGDVIAVPVSAKKRENIDQLLEMVLLTADILELKANPNKQAKGTVIEAQLDKNRGPVATLLVQRGTLKTGDAILSGSTFGHIRSMVNDRGRKIKEAGPSVPVEIFGLSEVPEAGDVFYTVSDEKVAKQLAEKRKEEKHQKHIGRAKVSLEDLFNQIKEGNIKELNLIIKADVQGSVEAIRSSMEKLSNDEVKVNVIHGAVGAIIEADITLAEVSNAIIIGFNVRPSVQVTEMAKEAEVDMRLYRVIYDAIEDIEKAMKGLLDPIYKEVVNGHAEIRQLFKVSGIGTIGGAYVTDGKILRNSEVRIVRNGIVVLEGKLSSLKRFKDDAKEVAAGYECGIMIERFNDIKDGDVIESFHMEEVQRS